MHTQSHRYTNSYRKDMDLVQQIFSGCGAWVALLNAPTGTNSSHCPLVQTELGAPEEAHPHGATHKDASNYTFHRYPAVYLCP